MLQKWKAEFHLLFAAAQAETCKQPDKMKIHKAEVEALTAISQLGYEQGKLAELKTQHQMQETAAKEAQQRPVQQPVQQTARTQEIQKRKLGQKKMSGLVKIMP